MNGSDNTQAVSIEGFDPRKLFAQGFSLGAADLIQGGSFAEVVGRTVISLLLYMRDKDGKRPFAGVAVILPPTSVTTLTTDSVHEALATGFVTLTGTAPNDKESAFLKHMTRVVNSPTLEVADLEAIVTAQGQHNCLCILGHRYTSQADQGLLGGVRR